MAGPLTSPFSFESTAVLPAGIRSVRLTSFTAEISQRFDSTQIPRPLAAKFNRPVTWGDLVKGQPSGFERDSLEGFLEAEGVSASETAGQALGEAHTRVTATLPVVAYGLSERLTAALVVPVVYSNLSVATGWAATPEFQSRLDAFSSKGRLYKLQQSEARFRDVVAAKISSLGYEPLVDEAKTEIGDIVFGLKYRAVENNNLSVALVPRLVAPTGRTANPNRVVDIAPGDGQWDLGLGAVVEAASIGGSRISVSAGASVLAQLPGRKAKRIPVSSEEALSSDLDVDVREDLGDIFSAQAVVRWRPLETWTILGQLASQAKQSDQYEGSAFDSGRYDFLEIESSQSLQTAQLGVAFSTIPLFRAGQFPIPLEAGLSYTWALAGQNVNKSDLAVFEMAAFF
jgi:hypothetical protein